MNGNDENNGTEDHSIGALHRWLSVGDIIALITSLLVIAFTYGKLSQDVESLTRSIEELQRREITPGAASAISAMQATDRSQDAQIALLRDEQREIRRETLLRLQVIEDKLDRHSSRQ